MLRTVLSTRSVIFRLAVGTVLTLLTASTPRTQPLARASTFDRLNPLLGRWTGSSDGQPGKGTVTREYAFVLNSRFIRVTNRTEYPPQQNNPKGEVHEDEGFFSFDRFRKRIVLRQFHVEGFVNQYVEELEGAVPQRIVFTSDSIENLPAGFRARETYLIHGPDDVEEVFEMSEAGKPFEVYSRARLKRLK